MKRFSLIIWILLIFLGVFRYSNAWTWLVAENGDYITVPKWNELVTYVDTKLSRSELLAGTGVTLTSSGSDITISTVVEKLAINTNREDSDLSLTRYYGTEYNDTTWKIDRETGSGTGTVRTTATNTNNAWFAWNYAWAWSNRVTITYE